MTNAEIKEFTKTKKGYDMHLKVGRKKRVLKADQYFQAVGRTPNIKGLELENAGVKYDKKGIETNRFLQTTAKNIYSCGDVTTPYKFTYTASHQANICVSYVFRNCQKSIYPIFKN